MWEPLPTYECMLTIYFFKLIIHYLVGVYSMGKDGYEEFFTEELDRKYYKMACMWWILSWAHSLGEWKNFKTRMEWRCLWPSHQQGLALYSTALDKTTRSHSVSVCTQSMRIPPSAFHPTNSMGLVLLRGVLSSRWHAGCWTLKPLLCSGWETLLIVAL